MCGVTEITKVSNSFYLCIFALLKYAFVTDYNTHDRLENK